MGCDHDVYILYSRKFSKGLIFKIVEHFGKLSGHIAWRQMISKNLLTTTTPAQQEKVCKTKYSAIVCQRQHGKDGKHDC